MERYRGALARARYTHTELCRGSADPNQISGAAGALKTLAGAAGAAANVPSPRFLIVTDLKDSSQVVLRQARF